MPPAVRQLDVFDDNGRFVARVDLAWPELGIFIELDGEHHKGPLHVDRGDALWALDSAAARGHRHPWAGSGLRVGMTSSDREAEKGSRSAAELLAEAEAAPVEGWSFEWMKGRTTTTGPAWDFTTIAVEAVGGGECVLDMGTGGGEWLSSVVEAAGSRGLIVATESWPPNVDVAAYRLRTLGVPVVQDEGAPDNVDQRSATERGRLAFRPDAFDAVLNRHESYVAAEVARVMRPGGQFLTQQAGSAPGAFHSLLGLTAPDDEELHLSLAVEQVEAAGLRVQEAEEGEERIAFGDVGVLARYLRQVPWIIPGFTIADHRDALARLDGTSMGIAQERFWLRAVKP